MSSGASCSLPSSPSRGQAGAHIPQYSRLLLGRCAREGRAGSSAHSSQRAPESVHALRESQGPCQSGLSGSVTLQSKREAVGKAGKLFCCGFVCWFLVKGPAYSFCTGPRDLGSWP